MEKFMRTLINVLDTENAKNGELEKKLAKAEKEINEGKTIKAEQVFKELENKYGF